MVTWQFQNCAHGTLTPNPVILGTPSGLLVWRAP
jgi:hypothetical protein